jgi:hypothetical protein
MLTPKSFGSNLLGRHHNHLKRNEMQSFKLTMINDNDTTLEGQIDTALGLSEENLN